MILSTCSRYGVIKINFLSLCSFMYVIAALVLPPPIMVSQIFTFDIIISPFFGYKFCQSKQLHFAAPRFGLILLYNIFKNKVVAKVTKIELFKHFFKNVDFLSNYQYLQIFYKMIWEKKSLFLSKALFLYL